MECLREAIRSGNVNRAKDIAHLLALAHQEKSAANQNGVLSDYINIRVYVEDRESSGAYMLLRVKPAYTISELKFKMMLEHDIPEKVQCWIINRKIQGDNVNLEHCGVHYPDFAAYLYLRPAEDVGIEKDEYDARRKSELERLKTLQELQRQQPDGSLEMVAPVDYDASAAESRAVAGSLVDARLSSDDFHMEPMSGPSTSVPGRRLDAASRPGTGNRLNQ